MARKSGGGRERKKGEVVNKKQSAAFEIALHVNQKKLQIKANMKNCAFLSFSYVRALK